MKKRTCKIYILSFVIPFSIFLLYALMLHIYPFGNGTVLFSDNGNQFVSFYTFFKNIFLSDNNFFYTFSKNLGGDMVGFSAYYLQNPFLFLLFFVKDKNIPAALFYIEALQLSLMGLTFQIFIKNAFGKENLMFSTAYSLIGYVAGYFTLPIYFCSFIMLPLIILGIYKIFSGEYKHGSLVYIISLALSIFFNYYIAYMICIFTLLYVIYMLFINYDRKRIKEAIPVIKVFVLSSVSAVFLSLFSLLPTLFSLRGAKNAPDADILGFFRMYRIFDSLSMLFTGSYDGNISNTGFPNIYIGIIPAYFAICFILNKKVKLKERIAALIFIAMMVFSLNIHAFNVIWHAFNEPVGFGYRFAFLLSFLLLIFAYKGYMSEPDKKTYMLSAALAVLYAGYVIVLNKHLQPAEYIIADAVIIILVAVIGDAMLCKPHGLSQKLTKLSFIPVLICISEIALNGFLSLNINLSSAASLDKYYEQYNRTEALIEEIKSSDSGFYRIEKDFMINMQDAMTFGYNGLTHNSSCETEKVKNFMEKLGFRNQGIWAFYNQGSTVFADTFLGVKYFVSRFDTTDKPYAYFANIGSDYIFKNEYALPLAFLADTDAIKNIELNTKNSFEIQNGLSKLFYSGDIYKKAEIEAIALYNLEESKSNGGGKRYKRIDKSLDAYIEFKVRSRGDSNNLYFLFNAPENQSGIHVYVNDTDYDDYFTEWRFNIERAGRFPKDSIVSIKLTVDNDELLLDDYYIYEEDIGALERLNEDILKYGLNNVTFNKLSSSHLKGSLVIPDYDTINHTVIYSIPFDEGWHIKLDGKPVKSQEVLDCLLAIDLNDEKNNFAPGNHEIDMYFIPKGIIIGSVISILTLICLIIVFTDKKHFFREVTD